MSKLSDTQAAAFSAELAAIKQPAQLLAIESEIRQKLLTKGFPSEDLRQAAIDGLKAVSRRLYEIESGGKPEFDAGSLRAIPEASAEDITAMLEVAPEDHKERITEAVHAVAAAETEAQRLDRIQNISLDDEERLDRGLFGVCQADIDALKASLEEAPPARAAAIRARIAQDQQRLHQGQQQLEEGE